MCLHELCPWSFFSSFSALSRVEPRANVHVEGLLRPEALNSASSGDTCSSWGPKSWLAATWNFMTLFYLRICQPLGTQNLGWIMTNPMTMPRHSHKTRFKHNLGVPFKISYHNPFHFYMDPLWRGGVQLLRKLTIVMKFKFLGP